jgi:fluoride exporter
VSVLATWLAIAAAGAIGSLARFLLHEAVERRVGRGFPLGTLAVNLSGALVLGILVGATVTGDAYRIAGTALLGAYTTFSTWMLETERLTYRGALAGAAANIVVSLAGGLAAVALGRRIGAL